jgi:hypothetical protein
MSANKHDRTVGPPGVPIRPTLQFGSYSNSDCGGRELSDQYIIILIVCNAKRSYERKSGGVLATTLQLSLFPLVVA